MDPTAPRIDPGARSPATQNLESPIQGAAHTREASASLGGYPLQTAELGNALDDAQQRLAMEALLRAIERLERTITLETGALDRNNLAALHEFNHMKSHGLLELKRAIDACQTVDRATFEEEAKAALAGFRAKLERNLDGLRMQLRAVSEIASIIARAIEDHESDGTYTAIREAKVEIQ